MCQHQKVMCGHWCITFVSQSVDVSQHEVDSVCVCVCAEPRPQRSAAEVRRELQAREEARNNVKLVWRALAALASGHTLDSDFYLSTLYLNYRAAKSFSSVLKVIICQTAPNLSTIQVSGSAEHEFSNYSALPA